MAVMIRLNDYGSIWPLLGRAQDALSVKDPWYTINYPIYNGASFDGSVTNLSYTIHPERTSSDTKLDVILSFVSPVTVNDTMRQSIPAGYLKVYVEGNVDASLYLDVNGSKLLNTQIWVR